MLKIWAEKLKNIFIKAFVDGCTPSKLTHSLCLGFYIAFSPFPGLHTVMMVVFTYLFDLHFPTLFIATSINNPWTMAPFFTTDYFFGYWLIHSFFELHPTWVVTLPKVFGSGTICLWSFLVGGNTLGLLAAVIMYPVAMVIFKKLAYLHAGNKNDENNNN